MRHIARLAALLLASLLWHAPALAAPPQRPIPQTAIAAAPACGSTTCFVFEAIAPRTDAQVKDFASFACAKCDGGKVRPVLNAALRAYQTNPSMKSAIGVLQFFTSDFYKMSAPEREALFAEDKALFLSVDIAKYEIVMQVRKELAKKGVTRSLRVGSSGQRELAIIEWVNRGRTGEGPGLSGTKQFVSDDDVTNRVMEITDPLADEPVNEDAAKAAFRDVTGRLFGNALDPAAVQVEFLSPTKAWEVFSKKYGSGAPPDFLNAFVRANPEKYNDPLGVYMLEKWGYDLGVVTLDVTNPMTSTTTVKAAKDKDGNRLFNPPGDAPSHGLAGYMADNYRQVYGVHDGKFESQCKYLVRMIDGWAAVNGAGQVTSEWLKIRTQAERVYKHGDSGPSAVAFKREIAGHIRNVVLAGHAFQLSRVEVALQKVTTQLKETPSQQTPEAFSQLLKASPALATELDGLLAAYTNVLPDVHTDLMQQVALRIDQYDEAGTPHDRMLGRLFTHVMEVVQTETDFQKGAADAFVGIRQRVLQNLGRALPAADVHQFLTRVAKGEVKESVLRREGWRVTRQERVLTPQEVLQHIELLHAVAAEAGWPTAREAERLRQYMSDGPDRGINYLQHLYRIFDASNAAPIEVPEVARLKEGQQSTRSTIRPSRDNMGLRLFATALNASDAARTTGQAVAQATEWWGHVQNGHDLFKNVEKLFTDSAGMTDAEIGQTQAALFANAVGLGEAFAPEFWKKLPLGGAVSSNTAGFIATNAGALGVDDAATDQLVAAAFKDLAILYSPHLAPAIALFDLASWAYETHALAADRSDIVQAMVENGVWEPADAKSLKALPMGALPRLKGIRVNAGSAPLDPKALATIAIGELTLAKSHAKVQPRKSLIDILWDSGVVNDDPVLAASRDAVREASGSYIARKLHLATLSDDGRAGPVGDGWSRAALIKAGILVGHREDDRSRRVTAADVKADKDGATPAELNHLRTLGLLVGDFWVKQQTVLEERLLPELEKIAAQHLVTEVRGEEAVESKNYLSQVDEIYQQVKTIDERLWPRIAQSAGPATQDGFDPRAGDQLLVLRAFKAADRVVTAVDQLTQIEAFLKNAQQETLDLRIGPETIPAVDRRSAELQAASLLQGLRAYFFEVSDAYQRVESLLDRGISLTREGAVNVEPVHLKLSPNAQKLTDGDADLAKSWVLTYQGARKRVLDDIVEQTKTAPPQGFLGQLNRAASTLLKAIGRDPIDTGGSPAHPLWPTLVRLRYEINKLDTMAAFTTPMAASELESAVKAMTDAKGEPVWKDEWTAGSAASRADALAGATAALKKDYQDLLARLTDLFTFKPVVVDNDTPFIGQTFNVTASPTPDPAMAKTMGSAAGFPDFVVRFRWTVRNASGGGIASEAESDQPTAPLVIGRAGTYAIEVAALDRGGNVVARSTEQAQVTAKSLTLRGTVAAATGDYAGETIALLPSIGGVRGAREINRLGPFELEVDEFDRSEWNDARMSARVSAVGRYSESNAGALLATPAAGLVAVSEELRLPFPFNVTVQVKVADAAGIDVPGAAVKINAGGREFAGRDAAARVWPGTSVNASATELRLAPPIEVSAQTAFDPANGRAIQLRAALPMFDVNHVTVFGRFVPDASLTPVPALTGGQVLSSIGNTAVGSGGGFTLRNSQPIDLRGAATIEAQAFATDGDKRLYRPKSDPLTIALRGAAIDLGSIEVVPRGITVKPIQARLFDVTGVPLPAGTGELLIGDTPAVRQGDLFVGEYTFTKAGESIIVQGGYRMPNGPLSVVQQTLTAAAAMVPNAPSPSFQMRLPFYLPGSLHVTGTTRVEKLPDDPAPPSELTIQDAAHGLSVTQTADAAFDVTLPMAVQATEHIDFAAAGKGSGAIQYRGLAATTAPYGAGSIAVGEIVLIGSGVPAGTPAFLDQSGAGDASQTASNTVPGFLQSESGGKADVPVPPVPGPAPVTSQGDALDKIRQEVARTNQSEAERIRQEALRRKAAEERAAAERRKAEEERLTAIRRKEEADRLAALREKEEQERLAADRRKRRADGAQAFLEGFLNGFTNGLAGANQPGQAGTLPDGTAEQPLKDIVVSSRRITISVWDSQCEDGDRISVRINGLTVVNNVTLTNARKSFEVMLPEPINSLELISESTGTDCPAGRVPPSQTVNSGAMSVSDAIEGGNQSWQLANATRGSSARIFVK